MVEEKEKTVVEMGEPLPVMLEISDPEEKPKRGRKKQSKEPKSENVELDQNITVMIKTVFDMLALRDPIWKLADQEVEAVSKPAARILTRLGAAEETNKNADYLLLVVGVAGIMLPRILIIRGRKESMKNDERTERRTERETGANNAKTAEQSSRRHPDNVKQLLPGLA